jgi:hypothetical protein
MSSKIGSEEEDSYLYGMKFLQDGINAGLESISK